MKSPQQRRQEIKARRLQRAERKACRVNARPVDRPVGTVAVTPALLRPTTSYGIPDVVRRGYYQDRPFRGKNCGFDEVWTAAQQRWWYEIAQGEVWTTAVRCRTCRQQQRARKAEARRIHGEGLAIKRERLRCQNGSAKTTRLETPGQSPLALRSGRIPVPSRHPRQQPTLIHGPTH